MLLRGRGGLPDLAVGSAVQFRVKWTGTNRLRERVGRVVGDFWYVHHSGDWLASLSSSWRAHLAREVESSLDA